MILQRKIYSKLLDWKNTNNGASALLIDGARRVGKSFICKQFAEKEYKSSIIIDFANAPKVILDAIENDTNNLDLFFSKLSTFYSVTLYERNSVIIFDEVQQFPRARQLIKYLVQDGRYDYIETGSLIRLKKNVQDIVIPSEEDHIEMFPLDFEEFLWALNDNVTFPFIKQCYESLTPLGQAVHRKILNDFRQYMLVGGMPQAVLEYVKEKNFEKVDGVKRKILHLYKDDIAKFAAGYEEKVYSIFKTIPNQLSKKEKKYKLTTNVNNTAARFRNYEDSFIWLNEAMIINRCLNATDPNIGLAASAGAATQKCYLADTGLLVTQTFADKNFTQNEIYKAILFDKLNFNEGMILENVVAQILRTNGHKLYFYSRNDPKHRENHMEIDFLITKGKKIMPLEVKSGRSTIHASLDKFCKKFSSSIITPTILYTKDIKKEDGVLFLPVYMASMI